MRLGVFGGSFDPFHYGHLRPILDAVHQLALDRVHYVPTGRPPHKPERDFAPALSRYAMTELALLDYEHLWVSTLELSENAPSFTIDTMLHFRRAEPEAEIYLLVGDDSFAEIDSWRRWEDILEHATLAVLSRPGRKPTTPGKSARSQDAVLAKGRVCFVDNQPIDVSSTEMRRLLGRGERPTQEWMPPTVVDFVLKYRLYR